MAKEKVPVENGEGNRKKWICDGYKRLLELMMRISFGYKCGESYQIVTILCVFCPGGSGDIPANIQVNDPKFHSKSD